MTIVSEAAFVVGAEVPGRLLATRTVRVTSDSLVDHLSLLVYDYHRCVLCAVILRGGRFRREFPHSSKTSHSIIHSAFEGMYGKVPCNLDPPSIPEDHIYTGRDDILVNIIVRTIVSLENFRLPAVSRSASRGNTE